MHPKSKKTNGFTLIELSIVLVIIGLVLGGILVGGNLIRVAQLRLDISQIEKLDIAHNAFRSKYNCTAGDCNNASSYFTGAINGSGDGKIYLNDGIQYWDNDERVMAFDHLSRANLIGVDGISIEGRPSIIYPLISQKPGIVITSCGYGDGGGTPGECHFHALGFKPTTDTNEALNSTAIYSGTDAFYIDSKLDDGSPLTGKVVARQKAAWDESQHYDIDIPAANGNCVTTAANNPYNIRDNAKYCALRIKARF